MGEKEKVTIMVLKVDLQCHKCYKKIKKVLCKFPQIRDQIYDEKQNQVVIKVVCCSPEKIRDKICCKGGSAIKSIEIKEPEKPKAPKDDGKPKAPKDDGKPKADGKPKDEGKPKADSKPKDEGKPKDDGKPKGDGKPKDDSTPKDDGKPKVGLLNPGPSSHVQACCMDCYQGHAAGPCHSGYSGGLASYIQYDGYYGRPVYDSYGGGNRGYCVTRPDCFSEENPSACTVM
ncbi:hypothetical protein ACFX2A_005513 [Malus domestica]